MYFTEMFDRDTQSSVDIAANEARHGGKSAMEDFFKLAWGYDQPGDESTVKQLARVALVIGSIMLAISVLASRA